MKQLLLVLLTLLMPSPRTSLLKELDRTLAERATYEGYFQQRISVLEGVLADQDEPARRYGIVRRLALEYSAYSVDSTMRWLGEGRDIAVSLGDRDMEDDMDLLTAAQYIRAGYHAEASDILASKNPSSLSAENLRQYYRCRHSLAGELMAYSQNDESFSERFWERAHYRDSLLSLMDEGSFEWLDLKREEAEHRRDTSAARDFARRMLGAAPEGSREYASACWFYQNSFSSWDSPEKFEWLVRSAMADIKSATKDYAALQQIAHHLYDEGDVDRAFHYASDYCMTDALFFKGKLRPWQILQFFPLMEQAYVSGQNAQKRRMTIMIAIVSALLVLVALILIVLYRRQQTLRSTRSELEASSRELVSRNRELEDINRRLESLNARIQEADKVKQEYIALFLGILSDNISKRRQYQNHVLKYIRMGNTKYLAEEVEALPPIDDDIQQFYKMFDSTFINLYPSFVEGFNGLLQEGEAILPKEGDILTPELRIFALVKLGISDSSKIATLLHYSANTIYNYRAKIKNKARGDRDKFEDAVRALD